MREPGEEAGGGGERASFYRSGLRLEEGKEGREEGRRGRRRQCSSKSLERPLGSS